MTGAARDEDASAADDDRTTNVDRVDPGERGDPGGRGDRFDHANDAQTGRTCTAEAPNGREALASAPERYVMRARLGEGAMGEVTLVRDPSIGRDVALKTVHARHGDAKILRLRLEREARVQGQLEHPAIVPVYEMGVGPGGRVFFTMKHVQGSSLRDVLRGLRRGDPSVVDRFPRRRLLAAFATVCMAVAFAHARGVLHRDIKPANVMLGEFGEVYLLDWGVARVRGEAELPADATVEIAAVKMPPVLDGMTAVGDAMGTPGFMAPEQLRGEAVDERCDVYALGAVLFELLTLEPLHPRRTEAAVLSTLRGAEARASERAPDRDVPPELEALWIDATALDRDARLSSARAMNDAIERYLDGDRDLARRRELAVEHADRAHTAALRAIDEADEGAHVVALEEANRAIALDPTNASALDVVRALAMRRAPPRAETDEALRASTDALRRILMRYGMVAFGLWVVGAAPVVLLGVRSPLPLFAMAALLLFAVAFGYTQLRRPNPWSALLIILAADLAAALVSSLVGPFILVPALLGTITTTFVVGSKPMTAASASEPTAGVPRMLSLVIAVLCFLGPVLLELTGVVPPSIAFRDDTIVLLPRAVNFPPKLTMALLIVDNTILVLVTAFVAMRIRDYALGLERRAFGAASHLRRLLPRETRAATEAAVTIPRETERAGD